MFKTGFEALTVNIVFEKNGFRNLADKREGGRGSEPYRPEAVKKNENRLSMTPYKASQ